MKVVEVVDDSSKGLAKQHEPQNTHGPMKEVVVSGMLAIPPASIGNVMVAAKKELNELLFRWNESLQAIPLFYSEPYFSKNRQHGRVIAEYPWVHIELLVKFYVFKPVIGMVLRGKVNQLSSNHVSLLVAGIFNASITSEEMEKAYKYDETLETWQSGSENDVNMGDIIDIEIAGMQMAKGLFYIEAKLPS
jgi:hypothetical protein